VVSCTFVVRPGRMGDEPALAAVHRAAALAAYRWVAAERWRDADWAVRVELGSVVVAERTGTVFGLATVLSNEVGSLYVTPSMQGRGVGAALLDEAERRLGGGPAVVWVIERNTAARAFYERAGWRLDGGRREDVWGPEVRYRKQLVA